MNQTCGGPQFIFLEADFLFLLPPHNDKQRGSEFECRPTVHPQLHLPLIHMMSVNLSKASKATFLEFSKLYKCTVNVVYVNL